MSKKNKPLLSLMPSNIAKPTIILDQEKIEQVEAVVLPEAIDNQEETNVEQVEEVTTTEIALPEIELEIVSEKEEKVDLKEYWEVVYYEGQVEQTIYTKGSLHINQGTNLLEIQNPFGRLDLVENVLNRKKVSYSCVKEIEYEMERIDCSKGVFIKNLSEQPWMLRNETETTILFNAAVLEVYRTQTAELLTATQTTRPLNTTTAPIINLPGSVQSPVPLNQPGNISPNQPGRPKFQ